MTLGTPEVSLQDYIITEVSTRQEEVYDSDRVVATLLKNIDPSYVAPSGGGGPVAPAGLDSESLVNFLYNEGYINAFALAVSSDSDNQLLRIEIQNVKNNLDSESVDLRSKIDVINTTLGSTLTSETLAIYLQQEIDQAGLIDSDGAARLFIEYGLLDSDQTLNMINEHYDSDAIIQTVLKGYNPAAAAYDSDLVVATISKKRGSLILDSDQVFNMINEHSNTDALDSDQVYNMSLEYGWNYDSDRVVDTFQKNFQYIINITNNNLGKVDSEFVYTMLDSEEVENMFAEHGLAYQVDLDSESAEIRLLRADVDALVSGTYNDAPVIARLNDLESSLDSESARINLLFSNADSDVVNIAILRRDADSDTTVIQDLRTQAEIDAANITLMRNDLDSDNIAIQNLSTRLNSVEAVNTIQNSRLVALEGEPHLDSDNVISLILENAVSITDSDLKAIADIRNDVDSDSIRIQDLQTQINNLVDDTGFDSDQIESMINEHVTPFDDSTLIARLDSDSIRIQDLQTQINNIDTASLRTDLDSDSVVIQSIRTAVDSDYALFNTKIALFNGLTDSDLTTVANLRNDVDSDSIRIQDLQTQINNLVDDTGFDSDQVVAIINENVTPYDDSGIIARLDSDELIVQSLQTQIDVLVAGTYDDSAVVARLDSDTTAIQDISSRVTVLEAAVDDTGFDSDQIESMINEHVTPYDDSGIVARLDSDETIIQSLQTQIDVLVAGTYDDSAVLARLDSDELIVQSLQTQIDFLTARLDSDTTVIQSLQTQLDGFDVADIRARLDSDSIAIQSIRSSVDSDYALFNAKIALFNGLTDSDLTTVSILRNDLDSESFEIRALRSDVDSDSIRIQTIAGQVAALEAGTYDDSALVARLDSDSAVLQELRSDLDDSEFIIERTPLRLNNASFATTSSNQVLDTYDVNEHKTVKYIISANKGTDWQSSECLVNHDGTTAYITEYSVMDSGAGDLYIPDVDVSGGAVRLLVTPQTTNINVSIIRTQIN